MEELSDRLKDLEVRKETGDQKTNYQYMDDKALYSTE